MAFNMCTSGAIWLKAGSGVNTTTSGARLLQASEEAEGTINSVTRVNYSDTVSGLNADVKGILQQVSSDLGGIQMITYNMAGYTSRIEAEDMINVLRDSALRGLSLLRDKKVQDFINAA